MSRPQAYAPIQGQMYQLLCRGEGERAFEHLDYAKDKKERNFLLSEYRLAYRGIPCEVKAIQLPQKYWKEVE